MKKKNNTQVRILAILIFVLLALSIVYIFTRRNISNDAGQNDVTDVTIAPSLTVTPTEAVQPPTATPTVTITPTHTTIPSSTPVPINELTVSPSPTPEVATSPSATPEATISPGPIVEPIAQNIEQLKSNLEEYISLQEGRYGLYFINLVTGEEFGINDKDIFIAASTTKLPMNLLLYKKIVGGEINFEDKLTYIERDFEAGSGTIFKSPYGTEYTVRETARLSIVYSDNCGINMIIRLLGIDNIRQYMLDLGGTVYYGSNHRTCPYDLAIYTRELYQFYEQEPDIAGILIDDLKNTAWNDRINKFLPKDVELAHKIGSYPGVFNDVGIVFASQPYAIAIMSEDINQSVASDVIAQLSKTIYDYIATLNESTGN
ncbi:MAG TPA: serine hydrolase [Thermoclostridium sp.]|nr:serine hydrolase [Thermoclostridium sp.]